MNCDEKANSYHLTWAQEMYLVMHAMGWTNFAEINSQTAHAG